MEKHKYAITYKRYNIFANDYIKERVEVITNDIYHEMGKIIAQSIEDIRQMRYFKLD